MRWRTLALIFVLLQLLALSVMAGAAEPEALTGTPETSAGPLPTAIPSPVISAPPPSRHQLSVGILQNGFSLGYEYFIDELAGVLLEAEARDGGGYTSAGLGTGFRYYPMDRFPPAFYGGALLRVFDQNGNKGEVLGYYRGLRAGPQIGIRIPIYSLVLGYDLAWLWDLSLYESDPLNPVGEAWMAQEQPGGRVGRLFGEVSLGFSF